MVDTLPLALISISATHTVLSFGLFGKIPDAMLTDLSKDRTVWTVVEITSDDKFGIGRDGTNGVYRLT